MSLRLPAPPTATSGTVYSGPIPIGGTTALRAAAFRDGWEPSNVDTLTFVFVADVVLQSATGEPPSGWPATWGGNTVDYGMDPDVVNGGDEGRPVVTADPDGPAGTAIRSVANRLLDLVPPAAADTCTARIAVLEEQLAGM